MGRLLAQDVRQPLTDAPCLWLVPQPATASCSFPAATKSVTNSPVSCRRLTVPVAHDQPIATLVPLTASTSVPSPAKRIASIMPSSPGSGSSSRGPVPLASYVPP